MNAHLAFCLIVLAIAAVVIGGCDRTDRGKCLRSHTRVEITYPNQGLIGLGTQYIPLALIPVERKRRVCDVWEFPEGRPQ